MLLDWRLGPLLRKAVFEHFVPKKCARQSNYNSITVGDLGEHTSYVLALFPLVRDMPGRSRKRSSTERGSRSRSSRTPLRPIVDQNLLKHEYPVNSSCEVA